MSPAPRLRFAPSPTGYLHIGGARTALFNWLYARKRGGSLVLRIEDTDRERSTEASVQAILDGLRWLGIDWDEGPEVGGPYAPYFQTQRLDSYRAHADRLIAEKKAFRCFCTREELDARRKVAEAEKRNYRYEGTCRELTAPPEGRTAHVIRFRVPDREGELAFTDQVLGRIAKPYSDLDDWVMMRGDGIPLYNFGCVVDDHLMAITHVGRGQEHINSTFPQLLVYDALGWAPPLFAHFPLILGPDKEKLSKRRHPEADVMLHREQGVLPEALLNFVVRLGWSHGDEEVIPREKQLEWFDFAQVGTTSGVWNPDKLHWLNQQYLRALPPEELARRFAPFLARHGAPPEVTPALVKLASLLAPRARTLAEMAQAAAYFFGRGVTVDEKAAKKHLTADARPILQSVRERLDSAVWTAPALDEVVKVVSEALGVGMGKVAQPLRVAVTGNTASPGIGDTLELIGQEESLRRIDEALARLP
jgi:glutamyl-tRNA synthetase